MAVVPGLEQDGSRRNRDVTQCVVVKRDTGGGGGRTWWGQSEEHVILDFGVVGLAVEST